MAEMKKAGASAPGGAKKKTVRKKAAKKRKTVAKSTVKKTVTKRATTARKTQGKGPVATAATERRQRLIAEAAYLRAERRGFRGGDPVEDWLEAEKEIDGSHID